MGPEPSQPHAPEPQSSSAARGAAAVPTPWHPRVSSDRWTVDLKKGVQVWSQGLCHRPGRWECPAACSSQPGASCRPLGRPSECQGLTNSIRGKLHPGRLYNRGEVRRKGRKGGKEGGGGGEQPRVPCAAVCLGVPTLACKAGPAPAWGAPSPGPGWGFWPSDTPRHSGACPQRKHRDSVRRPHSRGRGGRHPEVTGSPPQSALPWSPRSLAAQGPPCPQGARIPGAKQAQVAKHEHGSLRT